MDPHVSIHDLFMEKFPVQLSDGRKVGPEEEYVIVNQNGEQGHVALIYPELIRQGWKAKHDPITSAIIAVTQGDVCIGTDVGVGQLEIGFTPTPSLIEHKLERTSIMALIDACLEEFGLRRLQDYAAQPITIPDRQHWAPKNRSLFFRDFFHGSVHPQTASAASQCHYEVTRDEIVPVIEVFERLACVFIALSANSPVWAGKLDPEEMIAARQVFWERFTIGHGYRGNVWLRDIPQSTDEMVKCILDQVFLVHAMNGDLVAPNMPFVNWFETQGELSTEQLIDAFESHMGTLWWNARPRTVYGTVERRICCQGKDALAHHALGLGLIENLAEALEYVRQIKPDLWWQHYRDTLRHGMKADSMSELCEEVLEIAAAGLNETEVELLTPLHELCQERVSPAHTKLEAFEQGGLPALLELIL